MTGPQALKHSNPDVSTEGIPLPSIFAADLPNFQNAWDATSLSALETCPRLYQLSIIEGWRPKGGAPPLIFGSLLHACLEHVDLLLAKGTERWAAVASGVRKALKETGAYAEDGSWTPWGPLDKLRTRENLVRAIIWYYDQYIEDALTQYYSGDKPAIELSFSFLLPFKTAEGRALLWCGHIDKLVYFGDSVMALERKHTTRTIGSYYFDQYLMSDQIIGYVLAGQVVLPQPISGAIVEATQIAVGFSRTHRSPQFRTEEQMAEWLHNLRYWIDLAEQYARRNFWPMNRASCNNFGGCRFRSICSLSPAVREQALETHFYKDHWNPLVVREAGGDS